MKVALAALIDITEEAACVDGAETQARVYHEEGGSGYGSTPHTG